jgi:hypothetical protein
MGKRSQVANPICRVMTKDVDGVATFAVYGPNRRLVWLSVHSVTPTVVRLWPEVVRFLRDTLDELADPSNASMMWRLPWADTHPEYVVFKVPDGSPWLHVFAASPNAIRLTADRVTFLRDALADLPAMAPEHVNRRGRRTVPGGRTAVDMQAAGA